MMSQLSQSGGMLLIFEENNDKTLPVSSIKDNNFQIVWPMPANFSYNAFDVSIFEK